LHILPLIAHQLASARDFFAQSVARRRTRSAGAGGESEVEVVYDRSRHVIQITQRGGETAEFDDRPARFLLMDRDPKAKTLKPLMEWGYS